MKRLLLPGLFLSGLLVLTAFLVSLYKAWRLSSLAPEPGTTLVYHFSLYIPDNQNSFFDGIVRGARRAAAELDSAVSVHSIDPAKNELETAAFTGVDGIVVCPYLDDALARRQLEKLKNPPGGRMPVVLINHNIPSVEPWPFIGTNNFDMGRRIGLLLQGSSGPVRLAVVYSDKAPGIYAERELVEMGIATALGDKLDGPVMRFRTNLNPLDAETLLVNIFRSADGPAGEGGGTGRAGPAERGAVNTIVFTDSADTIAAVQTLVDMNLVGHLQVIGFGADPPIIESIRKGIIAASVSIDSERIGYEAIRSLAALRTTGYTSAQRMEALLSGDARSVTLDAVLAPNDPLARAIIEACKADAKYRAKLPVVTGQDAEFDSMISIKNGEQTSTVFKDTGKLAEAAISLADQVLKGRTPRIAGAVVATGDLAQIGNTGQKVVTTYLLDPTLITKSNLDVPVKAGFFNDRTDKGAPITAK